MVQFGSGFHTSYASPMDRDYGSSLPADNSTNDVGVSIKDLGFSTGLGPTPNINAVGAKMRSGVKTMELTFMGSGKGNQQGQTAGMFGLRQRTALKEMQEANDYHFTTHASVGVMGLAGMDQQGNFSRQNQKKALDEIKRAIEFAADVVQGGPVVVHTGEYMRNMVDSPWNEEGKWSGKFRMYKGEEERAAFRVVDQRSGQIVSEARKNKKIGRPIWNMANAGEEYTGLDGMKRVAEQDEIIYTDYEGNELDISERVPEFDEGKQHFKTCLMDWEDFRKEAVDMTRRARKFWRENKDDPDKWEKSTWYKFRDAKEESEIEIRPEEAYIIGTLETNAAQARGLAFYYGGNFNKHVENLSKLKKAKEFYQKLWDTTDPEERWRLEQQVPEFGDLLPPETKNPMERIDEMIVREKQQIAYSKDASASQWAQAEETLETMRNVESSDTYAVREGIKAYAQAGIRAMMETEKLEKQGVLKKPIAVAMENLFPESYGGHPDEFINLIESSREEMTDQLVQQGMKKDLAKKKAEDHIYGTFDTAHCNLWWKYWQGDPDKTIAENKQEFNKWMLEKVEKMAEKKVVGHLHLVDNYGYEDEHLAPGEGNTPVKEAVAIFKKHGFKGEMIVEPGADFTTDTSGTQTLLKAWSHFGSPVYGVTGGVTRRGWGDVQYGYFGQTQPPYFVFGGYSPSEDWTLWSGVSLE